MLTATILSAAPVMSQTGVKLNEVFANNASIAYSDESISDWVELYNTTAQPVNLSNCSLSDSETQPQKWTFPAGTTIPANGYLLVLLDSSRPASTSASSPLNTGFSIKAGGDGIYLYAPGALSVLDSLTFGIQAVDYTIGRVPAGTGNWVLTRPTPDTANFPEILSPSAGLKINEWMPSPGSGEDWFELYNSGEFPAALSGLHLTDDPSDRTQFQIPPLSFIGAGDHGYVRFWADDLPEEGANHATFKLSAGGESIGLYTETGTQIDLVEYENAEDDVSQGRVPDGGTQIASFAGTTTPEAANLIRFPGLVVSELLSHTDPPREDAVEFYNTTESPIDISGWWLSNSKSNLKKYRVPSGTVIPAKGYRVFYEYEFNGARALDPFTFSAAYDDEVYLAQANASGDLNGYVVNEEFEASENGVSFIRHETSVPGDYKFVASQATTFGADDALTLEGFRAGRGAANSGPRVGPVVINEIMYHPRSLDGITDNVLDEFIELLNITSAPVALYDPAASTNRWVLKDAVNFTFPPLASIPADGLVIVVPFDPAANASETAAFRAKYSIPQNIQLFGPYVGKLGNGGDSIELYRPDAPQRPPREDAGFVPYLRVDKVNYLDVSPWPAAADGSGQSLQRKTAGTFGNDPANWEAAPPTAGQGGGTAGDSDQDGMSDDWETANGFDPNNASDAGADADSDGLTNLEEYVAGTDPRSAASRLAISEVQSGNGGLVSVKFQAAAGKTYTVQYRDSLDPGSEWQILTEVSASPNAAPVEVTDPGAPSASQRYYRLSTP